MGKLITFLSILIFIDILFIVTGQLATDSTGSVIAGVLANPEAIKTTNFWASLITGLSALAIGAVVVVGLITKPSDITIFIAMGLTLAVLIGDYLSIFLYLTEANSVLATILFLPVMLIFTFVIIEWVRGKD